jgi:hypothetical protein
MRKMNKLFGLWTLLLAIGGSCNAMDKAEWAKKMGQGVIDAQRTKVNVEELRKDVAKGEGSEHKKMIDWFAVDGSSPLALLMPLAYFGRENLSSVKDKDNGDTLLRLYLDKGSKKQIAGLLLSVTSNGTSERAKLFSAPEKGLNEKMLGEKKILMLEIIRLWRIATPWPKEYIATPGQNEYAEKTCSTFVGVLKNLGAYMGRKREGDSMKDGYAEYDEIILKSINVAGTSIVEGEGVAARTWVYQLARWYIMPYLLENKITWNSTDEERAKYAETWSDMLSFIDILYMSTINKTLNEYKEKRRKGMGKKGASNMESEDASVKEEKDDEEMKMEKNEFLRLYQEEMSKSGMFAGHGAKV